MDVIGKISSTLRDANESLASAQKAWRDEQLNHREAALVEREKQIELRTAELRRLEHARFARKLKYLAGITAAGTVAFLLGGLTATPSSVGGTDDGTQPQAAREANAHPLKGVRTFASLSDAESIHIPTDARAEYKLISWSALANGNRESINYRNGPSGESYARREIDCRAMKFRYLGEGNTLSEALLNKPSVSMGPLTAGSISTAVAEHVCSK